MAVGPLAGIHMLTVAELNGVDGLIGSEVVVVERQIVETDTIGEFQLVGDVPLILSIEAQLIEGDLSVRIVLAVEAVGDGERLRTSLIQEVLDAVVTIVTCTVTHVGIVGELMLEAQSGSDLVSSQIEREVISNACDLVLYTIIICKELVTQ